MSKNIYDIFNNRKNDIDNLNESGYNFVEEYENEIESQELYENAEAFDTLEEALSCLDDIVEGANTDWIEFEAVQYLEELVIESMMYESWVEEAAAEVVDAHDEDSKKTMIEKLKEQWQKIKDWFAQLIKTLENFFVNGVKLVEKNKAFIPDAMKNCKARVKMCTYFPYKEAMVKLHQKVAMILAMGKGVKQATKESVLRSAGVKDKKEVAQNARSLFVREEAKEMNISDIDPKLAMDWCMFKNDVYQGFMKLRATYDLSYSIAIEEVKKESKGNLKELRHRLGVMHFANGIKSEFVKVAASCSKNACTNYTAVIRKALGTPVKASGKERDAERDEKIKDEIHQYQAKQWAKKQGDKIKGQKLLTASYQPIIDIDDIQFMED